MLKTFTQFINLIFENACLMCSESCYQNRIWKNCENNFTLRNKNNNVKIFNEITVYSWGMYDGKLRDGIIALKAGKKKLANFFSNRLVSCWNNLPEEIRNKHYIAHPVPSHKKRIKERGYCQTSLMSKKFSQMTGLIFSDSLIKRRKQTQFMNNLDNINARKENIKNAFEIINPINVKNILVIDDILTSGNTLCEIAKTIHKAYPNTNILGLTVAAGDRYN